MASWMYVAIGDRNLVSSLSGSLIPVEDLANLPYLTAPTCTWRALINKSLTLSKMHYTCNINCIAWKVDNFTDIMQYTLLQTWWAYITAFNKIANNLLNNLRNSAKESLFPLHGHVMVTTKLSSTARQFLVIGLRLTWWWISLTR